MFKRFHWFWATLLIAGVLIGLPMLILIHNNRPVKISVPTPTPPTPNGWDDFMLAGEMIGKTQSFYQFDLDRKPEAWKRMELEEFVHANKPALDTVRAGLKKPFLQPPVRSLDEYFNKRYPQYLTCTEIALTLCMEARYYESTGQPEKAMDSLLDCIEFGVTIPRGGGLESGISDGEIESMAVKPLSSILPGLDTLHLTLVASRMGRIQAKRVPYSDILVEDGRCQVASLAEILNDPYDYGRFSTWMEKDDSAADILWNMQQIFANKTAIIRAVSRYYKDLELEQSGHYTGKTHIQLSRNAVKFGVTLTGHDIVSDRTNFTRNESVLALLQTEVALRRYHAAHGQYPKSLDQLVPKYLKSVPVDPFGQGKPLKYRAIDGGKDFLLYSIGIDMKDDGGKPIPWRSVQNNMGDFVAGKPGLP